MRKEQLQPKLLTNIKFVSILFAISTLLFVYELYMINIASPSLIEIQTNLIFKDYFIFLMFGVGAITLGLSIYLYFVLHTLSYKMQVVVLLTLGILLFPFGLLMMLYGFMIMIDRPKLKTAGTYAIMFFGFIFLITYALVLTSFAENKAIYTEAKIYEFSYAYGDDKIDFTIEVLYKENELISTTIHSDTLLRSTTDLNPLASQLLYTLTVSGRFTCYGQSTFDYSLDLEESCTMLPSERDYREITLPLLLDAENFGLNITTIIPNQDLNTIDGELTLISEKELDNYYD